MNKAQRPGQSIMEHREQSTRDEMMLHFEVAKETAVRILFNDNALRDRRVLYFSSLTIALEELDAVHKWAHEMLDELPALKGE